MSHPVKVTFDDDDYTLAIAYAKDHGRRLASIARSLVMSEVNRHAKRSGLLTALESLIDSKVKVAVADALTAQPHVGESDSAVGAMYRCRVCGYVWSPALFGRCPNCSQSRWVGGEKEGV